MPAALAISGNTFRESVRQPVYWTIVVITIALMAMSAIFAAFALGEESKLVRDAGLTSITIAGVLLAIFLSSSVVADEIEKKTAFTILCKPVHRYQFIFGKYLGISCAIFIAYIILATGLLLTTWLFESPIKYGAVLGAFFRGGSLDPRFVNADFPLPDLIGKAVTFSSILSLLGRDLSAFFSFLFPNLAKGILLSFCEVAILSSAALAVSTRASMILNVCITLSLFVLGHQVGYFLHILSAADTGLLPEIVRRIVPNFELLNYASDIAFDKIVPIRLIGQLIAYTVGWIAVFLLLAIALFDQREIA
ncbi:MAG TPA: ABC transporter permease subunit [Planctomycetota bacterium]|nr:ABC transporter permease subunit [Planctomycetota bacterium]